MRNLGICLVSSEVVRISTARIATDRKRSKREPSDAGPKTEASAPEIPRRLHEQDVVRVRGEEVADVAAEGEVARVGVVAAAFGPDEIERGPGLPLPAQDRVQTERLD